MTHENDRTAPHDSIQIGYLVEILNGIATDVNRERDLLKERINEFPLGHTDVDPRVLRRQFELGILAGRQHTLAAFQASIIATAAEQAGQLDPNQFRL